MTTIPQMLIVYGSSKGRTARIARVVEEAVKTLPLEVVSKNVTQARAEEILHYSYCILGCSTYGQGDLNEAFYPFERGMDVLDLHGIRGAVFGSGNSRYPYFGEAVDILEAKIKIQGGQILLPGLRQDMMISKPEGEETRSWAEALKAAVQQREGWGDF